LAEDNRDDDEHAVSLDTLEALFRLDGNPLHVLEALGIVLDTPKPPLPPSLNAHLLEGVRQILAKRDEAVADIFDGGADFEKVTDQAGVVGKALGFANKRGVPSHFDAASLDTRNEHIFNDVMNVMDPVIRIDGEGAQFLSSPEKLDQAYDIVAEQWGLQRSTVVNACRSFLRRWRAVSGAQPQPHASEMRLFVEWRLQKMNAAIKESQAAMAPIDQDAQDDQLS
jgi:hypothetical protein